jgi:hypothetical protein
LRWVEEFLDGGLVHVEDGIEGAKTQEFLNDGGAEGRRKDLGSCGAYLRGEDAHPNLFGRWLRAPEAEKVLKVAWTPCDLAGDGAVDGDYGVGYVLQDAFVGGRGATEIVLGLEAVDGYDEAEALEVFPMGRNGTECAGYNLGVDAAAFEFGKDRFEFTEANERISADERDVEGFKFVDGLENVSDEFVVFIVRQLTEGGISLSAEVSGIVGVASRTAEGTLTGNFDGKRWTPAQENGFPCLHDF